MFYRWLLLLDINEQQPLKPSRVPESVALNVLVTRNGQKTTSDRFVLIRRARPVYYPAVNEGFDYSTNQND
jgi:hypothetical protein